MWQWKIESMRFHRTAKFGGNNILTISRYYFLQCARPAMVYYEYAEYAVIYVSHKELFYLRDVAQK